MGEVHCEYVSAFLPGRALGSGNLANPLHHVDWSVLFVLDWFGDESERVVTSPILPFLLEAVNDELVDLFFVHRLHVVKEIMKNLNAKATETANKESEFIRICI